MLEAPSPAPPGLTGHAALCRALAQSFPTPSRDPAQPWEARSQFPRWGEEGKGLPGVMGSVHGSSSGWRCGPSVGMCQAWAAVFHAQPPALRNCVASLSPSSNAGTYSLQLVASSGLSSPRVDKQLKTSENANCKLPAAAGALSKVCLACRVSEPDCSLARLSLVMTVTRWKGKQCPGRASQQSPGPS